MDGASRVHRGDARAHLLDDPDRFIDGEVVVPPAQERLDGLARDVLHHEVGNVAKLPVRVDLDQVDVLDARHGARLDQETLVNTRAADEPRLDELDRDGTVELLIATPVHHAHRALAERALQHVGPIENQPRRDRQRDEGVALRVIATVAFRLIGTRHRPDQRAARAEEVQQSNEAMSDDTKVLAGLEARLVKVRARTLAGFPARARALREAAEALDAGDPHGRVEIERLAHKLRGIAGSVGHGGLGERASRLENAASTTASDLAISEGARRLARAIDEAPSKKGRVAKPLPPPPDPLPDAQPKLGGFVIALDDEEATRRLLSITLKSAGGAQVFVTGEPERALREAEKRTPTLVIVDAMMPTTDGLRVYRQVRSRVGLEVPVAILSAAGPDELGWTVPDEPRLRWFRKPFRPALLVARLRAFVDGA